MNRDGTYFFTRGGCVSCLRACLGARFLPQSYQYSNLSEGADRVGGQLRGDKECPFSGVTKSGRVWRKVPESDALVWLLVASQMDFPQLRFVRVPLGLSQQLFTSGEAPCCRRKHTDSIIAYRTRGREGGGEGEHGEVGGGGDKTKANQNVLPEFTSPFRPCGDYGSLEGSPGATLIF